MLEIGPVISTLGGRFPQARPQLTFVAKLATKVDLRTRAFPAGVATRRSNHLVSIRQIK